MRNKDKVSSKNIVPIEWDYRPIENCSFFYCGGVSSHRQSRFEPATRSLATFVRSHHSLRSLAPQRSTSLHLLRSLTPFTGSLTHFTHSLVGQFKFLNMCSRCYRVSREQTRFWRSLETRPVCSRCCCLSMIITIFRLTNICVFGIEIYIIRADNSEILQENKESSHIAYVQ